MHTRLLSAGGLLLAVIAFLAINVLANQTLTSWRLDVTDNRLYTLSQGSRNILDSLQEPTHLRFYFSNRQLAGYAPIQNYGVRIRDLLEEYQARSHGQIKLTVIDPEPFSEAEDQAVTFGIRQIPVSETGDMAYFGLAGTNTIDQELVIPFFQPDKEDSLEYELTKLIYQLAHPSKRVIGVMSGLPVFGAVDPARGGAAAWTFIPVLRDAFEVREVRTDVTFIDRDIDTLLVIHPNDLSEQTQYAIDQFMLRGGKAMVFVDPSAEAGLSVPDPLNPAVISESKSDLPKLLQAWGVKLVEGKIVGDIDAAMRVSYTGNRGPQEIEYLPWLHLEAKNLNQEDFITNQLRVVNVGSGGALQRIEGATTTVTPLLQTGPNSAFLDAEAVTIVRDPRGLLENFKPGGKEMLLAARISGKVRTAFPDGRPKTEEADKDDPDFLQESRQDINVIVVADTDLLSDRLWVRMQNYLGVQVPSPVADNAVFVINALDRLGGNDDLISLRSRGTSARPFKVVEQIRREAETQFRDEERALQQKLEETERKIAELQQQKGETGSAILSPQQKEAIEKFREEQVSTRKALRDVQHDLRKNIEGLGTALRIINIGLIPVILGVVAILVALYRVTRRPRPAAG
ncbi:MAG: Gldg family protein [Chromatiales bacterium]